jgi:lipopolysaccharide transport system permease protein
MNRGNNNSPPRVIVIEPKNRFGLINIHELWQFRELLQVLTVRDIRIRYKQTALGVLWVILQPLVAMVVFTMVLHDAAGLSSPSNIPYPIYTFSGLVIWNYFSDALTRSSRSLLADTALIAKIYFPRLMAPLASIIAPLFDFMFAFAILFAMMFYYDMHFTWRLLLAAPIILVTALCASAFGVWLAALNVEYRDIAYAVPMALNMWMFLSPVVYSPSKLGGTLKIIYALNPMAGILMAFRWCMLGRGTVDWGIFAVSMVVLTACLIGALAYFKRVERTFADAI